MPYTGRSLCKTKQSIPVSPDSPETAAVASDWLIGAVKSIDEISMEYSDCMESVVVTVLGVENGVMMSHLSN